MARNYATQGLPTERPDPRSTNFRNLRFYQSYCGESSNSKKANRNVRKRTQHK